MSFASTHYYISDRGYSYSPSQLMAALVISCHSTGRNEQLILVPTPLGGTATSHSKIGEFNNCEKVRENWSSSYKQTGGGRNACT